MKIRSYRAYLEIPLGAFMLFRIGADVLAGKVDLGPEILSMLVWTALGLFWFASGIVKIRHPYIVTDDRSIRVFGHALSNRLSREIQWDSVAVLQGRTFSNIILTLKNGEICKIPIGGMGHSTLRQFLSLIERKAGSAHQRVDSAGT